MDTIATEVGTAYLSIVAATKGMTKDIKSAFGDAVGEGDVAGKKSGKGFLGGLGGVLVKGAAVLGVGAAVGTAISKGMSRAISIEDAQAKLRGLGHDGDAVAAIMKNALASVKGTSFGLGEAATTAAGAVAAGIKPGADLERVLKSVANSAAAAGVDMGDMGNIFNKVASVGKAQNDALAQVADRGIPIYQALADQLGVTTDEVFKMASAGKIGFAQFEQAMTAASGTAAAELGQTFSGTVRNVQAALGRLGAAFLAPGLTAAKPILRGLIGLIDGMTDAVTPAAAALGRLMLPAAERLGASLSKLGGHIGKVGSLFELFRTGDFNADLRERLGLEEDSAIVGAVFAIRGAFVDLAAVASQAWSIIRGDNNDAADGVAWAGPILDAASALSGLGGTLGSVGPMLLGLLGPFGAIAGLAMRLGPAFMDAAAGGGSFGDILGRFVANLGPLLADMLAGLGDTVAQVLPIVADAIVKGLPIVAQAAGSLLGMLAETVAAVLPELAKTAGTILSGIAGVIAEVLPEVVGVAAQIVPELIGAIVGIIPTLLPAVVSAFAQLLGGIVEAAAVVLPAVIESAVMLVNAIVGLLPTLIPVLLDAAVGLLEAIVQAIPVILPPLLEGVLSLVMAIVQAVPTLIPTLLEAAVVLLMAIVEAIPRILPLLITGIVDIVAQLAGMLPTLIPVILTAAISLFTALVESLPVILPALIDGVVALIEAVVGMIPTLIPVLLTAAVALFTSLVRSIPIVLPALLGAAGQLILSVVALLPRLIPQLLSAAVRLFMAIVSAVPQIIGGLIGAIGGLIGRAVSEVGRAGPRMVQAGKDMLRGFIDGIKAMAGRVAEAAKAAVSSAVNGVKNFLGIRSPSRLFMELGGFTGEGFTIGLEAETDGVARAAAAFARAAVPEVPTDPWDAALADLAARVTPPPLFIEPPATQRTAEPVTTGGDGVEVLLLRLIAAVEAGQTINLDGDRLVGETSRRMSQALSSSGSGKSRAAGVAGLEV